MVLLEGRKRTTSLGSVAHKRGRKTQLNIYIQGSPFVGYKKFTVWKDRYRFSVVPLVWEHRLVVHSMASRWVMEFEIQYTLLPLVFRQSAQYIFILAEAALAN